MKQRKTNIELLRVFAALSVILLHYNNMNLGKGFSFVQEGSINQFIMTLLETICICAVNIYVLISGYFMRDSKKRNFIKPLQLIAQLIIFETAFFIVKEVITDGTISLRCYLDYLTPSYWFIFVYIALYFISPYINHLWNNLKEKEKKGLLIISLIVFSIYPIIIDIIQNYVGTLSGASTISITGSLAGYSIVNFVFIYLIGCYIKDREENIIKISTKKIIIFLILDIIILMVWTYLEHTLTGNIINATTAWNYENPLVILEAILFFLLFKRIKIKDNKIINKLALAAFPSYLIHLNLLSYFHIEDYVIRNPIIYLLHEFITVIIIYIISFIIFIIYDFLTKPLFNKISKKIKKEIIIS